VDDDEDDQALQAIYDVDGAIRNFNHHSKGNPAASAESKEGAKSQYNS
jgi:hypothetical protein